MATLWKAEVTSEMVQHLSDEQRKELINLLTKVVDTIGQSLGVGREYENGKLKESVRL
jgi:uncharacterized tellurite resistance protein B-like protein